MKVLFVEIPIHMRNHTKSTSTVYTVTELLEPHNIKLMTAKYETKTKQKVI